VEKRRACASEATGYHPPLEIKEKYCHNEFFIHMNKSLTLLGVAAILASASAAQAAPTTFTFSAADKGQTALTKTLDGINLTIDSFNPGPRSGADSDGLAIYCVNSYYPCRHNGIFEDYTNFQMTFDTIVRIISYNVTYKDNANDSSTTYLQGVLQSVQNNASGLGLTSFTNQFIAAANVPILVSTIDGNNSGLLQINAFTVEKVDAAPAPVPSPLPLAGAAAAFGLSRQLRRRIRQSSGV
jgi:hypothetical protein